MTKPPSTPWEALLEFSSPRLRLLLKNLEQLPDPNALVMAQTLSTGLIVAFTSDMVELHTKYPGVITTVMLVLNDVAAKANANVVAHFAEERGLDFSEIQSRSEKL